MNTLLDFVYVCLLVFLGFLYPIAGIAGACILRKEEKPRKCFGTVDALTHLMSPMVMVWLVLMVGSSIQETIPIECILSAIIWTINFVFTVFVAGVEVYEY